MKRNLSGNDWLVRSDAMSEPIPAVVPGIVQQDLINAGLTTDFWYGMGPEDKYEACRHNWEYTKEFVLTEEECSASRYTLVFQCVDFTCEVYLNDIRIGSNNGEYKLFRLDATEAIHAPGHNRLKVVIEKMPPELYDYLVLSDGKNSGADSENMEYWFVNAMNKTRQRLNGLKSVATFSYDWSSNLYTLGIPKDVLLETTNEARIDWLKYTYSFSEDYRRAEIAVEAETTAFSTVNNAELIFTLSGHGTEASVTKRVSLPAGINFTEGLLTVEEPALWWPVRFGEQPLYDVTVTLLIDGTVSDRRQERIGLRDIRWEQCEGLPADFIHPLALTINGKRIRSFGSCFITIDAFKAHEGKEKQRYFAELAKRGNMNVLRVHSGQCYYYDEFRDYCDEHGIMLFVDMPIANCVPEDLPGMYDMYRETFSNFIKQLRRHPSIIEWAGGNEMGWYTDPTVIHPALALMFEVGKECDPQRIFRSTCPIVGTRHGHYDYNPDNHYEEYDAMLKDNCNNAPMQRNGEFACSTPSNIEIWNKYIPSKDRFPLDSENEVLIRKNVFYSISPTMWMNMPMIERMFGPCDSLKKLLRAGQYMAGEGLRYAMDSFRARGKRFGGFSTWDFNEPAPNGAGCCLADFEGQPFHSFYMAREAMEEISICLHFESVFYNSTDSSYADVILNSDAPETVYDLRWEWVLRDRRGRVYRSNSGVLPSIDPVTCVKVDTAKINPSLEMKLGPVFMELRLFRGEERISERVQFFAMKGVIAPLAGLINKEMPDVDFGIPYTMTGQCGGGIRQTVLSVSLVGRTDRSVTYSVKNNGDMTALCCQVKPMTHHLPMLFLSNNYISIPPGEEREVTLESLSSLPMNPGITVEAFNSPLCECPPEEAIALMSRFDGTNSGYATEGGETVLTADGIRLPEEQLRYLCDGERSFRFRSRHDGPCTVTLGITDASPEGVGLIVSLNGVPQQLDFSGGYGLKKSDPDQLCSPEANALVFPTGLKAGENTLTVTPLSGWFAWDALLVSGDSAEKEGI